ncbi:hypothetical protein EJ08DRAFT_650526, partial [Tothia fuscella]
MPLGASNYEAYFARSRFESIHQHSRLICLSLSREAYARPDTKSRVRRILLSAGMATQLVAAGGAMCQTLWKVDLSVNDIEQMSAPHR